MKPSEYAYNGDSVNRDESPSANCRNYPGGPASQEKYIHCDGTQLRLTDSNLGPEQYQTNECYRWSTGTGQLLFIFPTRVSLTTITLHYYSGNFRGLPRLRFYALSDDFNVWDGLIGTAHPHVDVAAVPAGGEPAGRRNISINISFNTKKVLMYKFSSTFQFVASEVEFFMCITISAPSTTTEAITTTSQSTTAATFTSSVTTHLTIPLMVTTTNKGEVRNYVDE